MSFMSLRLTCQYVHLLIRLLMSCWSAPAPPPHEYVLEADRVVSCACTTGVSVQLLHLQCLLNLLRLCAKGSPLLLHALAHGALPGEPYEGV